MRMLLIVAAMLVAGNVQAQEYEWTWYTSSQDDTPWETASDMAVDSLGRVHTLGVYEMGGIDSGILIQLSYVVDDDGRTTNSIILPGIVVENVFSPKLLLVSNQPRVTYVEPGAWVPGPNPPDKTHYGYATAIPEPGTWGMLAMAWAVGSGWWMVKRRRR